MRAPILHGSSSFSRSLIGYGQIFAALICVAVFGKLVFAANRGRSSEFAGRVQTVATRPSHEPVVRRIYRRGAPRRRLFCNRDRSWQLGSTQLQKVQRIVLGHLPLRRRDTCHHLELARRCFFLARAVTARLQCAGQQAFGNLTGRACVEPS